MIRRRQHTQVIPIRYDEHLGLRHELLLVWLPCRISRFSNPTLDQLLNVVVWLPWQSTRSSNTCMAYEAIQVFGNHIERRHSCFDDPSRADAQPMRISTGLKFHPNGGIRGYSFASASSRIPSSSTFCAPLPLRSCTVPHSGQRQRGLRSSATAFSTCPHSEQV